MSDSRELRKQHDDGFGVVEVVVAAFILFFALTALIGLMSASTNMTLTAKGRSVVTNLVASELDRLRAIPYDQLALTTATPPGQITPTRTVTADGYTITLAYLVEPRDGGAYKWVRVTATGVRAGFPDVATEAHAYVRNRAGGLTNAALGAPTIEFLEPTPLTDTIVEADSLHDGTPLIIKARATSDARLIERIEFVVGGEVAVYLRDGTSTSANEARADFTPATNEMEVFEFRWHTGQVDEAGVPSISDGRRIVRIIAYDDQGRASKPLQRTFVVDNLAPHTAPGSPTITQAQAMSVALPVQSLALNWTAARDGTDPASSHSARVYENTNGNADTTNWTQIGTVLTAPGVVPSIEPFGCYALRVHGLSPLQKVGPPAVGGPAYTRPVTTGTYDVTRTHISNNDNEWRTTSRPAVAGPRFPFVAGSAKVELLRWRGTTALATLDVTPNALAAWGAGTPFTHTDLSTQNIRRNDDPERLRYQYSITITPQGWGATQQVLRSNFLTADVPTQGSFPAPGAASNRPMAASW